mmetsp:Transcript_4129/g.26077  ORF Transcript_4129/g.26077 Transcript_4129/m.26077 type:complete len:213 (+) Transcript_4129:1639-2277(+)
MSEVDYLHRHCWLLRAYACNEKSHILFPRHFLGMDRKKVKQKFSFRLRATFGRPPLNVYLKESFYPDWIVTFCADQLQHLQAQSSFRQQPGHVHRRSIDTSHPFPPDDATRPLAFFFPPHHLSFHVRTAVVSNDVHSSPTVVFRGRFDFDSYDPAVPSFPRSATLEHNTDTTRGRPRVAPGDDLEPSRRTGEACLFGQEGGETWTAICQSRL